MTLKNTYRLLFVITAFLVIAGVVSFKVHVQTGPTLAERIAAGDVQLDRVLNQPQWDGSGRLEGIPEGLEPDKAAFEAWVDRDPLYNILDVPTGYFTSRMWRVWSTTIIEEGLLCVRYVDFGERDAEYKTWRAAKEEWVTGYRCDLGPLQSTVSGLRDNPLSFEDWAGFWEVKEEVLAVHPIVLAFLPSFVLDRPGLENSGDVDLYSEMLESEDPYWAIVGSGDLPVDFVHAIPLEVWGKAISSFRDSSVNEYFTCSLNKALVEAGYTEYRNMGCEFVKW